MLGAGHPRRVSLDHRTNHPEIQRPPTSAALALVIAPAPPIAATAPTPPRPRRPHMSDKQTLVLVELELLHGRVLDPEQPGP